MIVSIEIPPATQATIREHKALAEGAKAAMSDAMETTVAVGGEDIRAQLVKGSLGLRMQNPASGLAASVMGWMLDKNAPVGAVGVPSNSPASAYAAIHEHGGIIRPKNAKALAIPISAEAKKYTSPRQMSGLQFIPRDGKPPLLAETKKGRFGKSSGVGARMEVHWVLVPSVMIQATGWLSKGAVNATPAMVQAFGQDIDTYVDDWNR